jgi:hypothetical protein
MCGRRPNDITCSITTTPSEPPDVVDGRSGFLLGDIHMGTSPAATPRLPTRWSAKMAVMTEMSEEDTEDANLRRLRDQLAEAGIPAVYNPDLLSPDAVTIDLLDEAFHVSIRVGPQDPRGYEIDVWADDGTGNGPIEDVSSCVYNPWVIPLVRAVVQRIIDHGSMPATDYRPVSAE